MKAISSFGFHRSCKIKINISKKDSKLGITKMTCIECEGKKKNYIPNGEIELVYTKDNPCPMLEIACVVCKGTGEIYIGC